MKRLVCQMEPQKHGGRVVFDEDEVHYCVECNTILVPEEEV